MANKAIPLKTCFPIDKDSPPVHRTLRLLRYQKDGIPNRMKSARFVLLSFIFASGIAASPNPLAYARGSVGALNCYRAATVREWVRSSNAAAFRHTFQQISFISVISSIA